MPSEATWHPPHPDPGFSPVVIGRIWSSDDRHGGAAAPSPLEPSHRGFYSRSVVIGRIWSSDDRYGGAAASSVNETIRSNGTGAAATGVQRLPSTVILREEDVVNKNELICSICMDEIKVSEEAKLLRCCHWYHGECITPWFEIKNTCPLCRYKL